jgi:nucleotide-binding universal stress UspA family protein
MSEHTRHTELPAGAVLAGVDGSTNALAAARWAAAEAASRRAPLVLLHAAPYLDADAGPRQLRHARGVLGRALGEAEHYLDRDQVRTEFVAGEPVQTLTEVSAGAALLALGLTGTGGLDEILLGSTTLALSGRVRCPLVGVRQWPIPAAEEGPGFVLLGLSSVQADADAVETAFELADRRNRDLVVLHARHRSGVAPATYDDHAPERQQDMLAWDLRGWRHRYNKVTVRYELPDGQPANELLRHAAGAEVVVVGSRKRGPAARALLGSTGRTILRYSPVPAIVIGPEAAVHRQPAIPPAGAGDPHALSNLW